MNAHRTTWNVSAALSVAVIVLAGLTALSLTGCRNEPTPGGGAPAAQPSSEFANVRCPIMGTPIDAANVPPDLTRTYKGQKVAFCCAGCPAAWDKLTDDQKAAKLAAAIARK